MADLPIEPDYSSPIEFEPGVLKAEFGDGYGQRAADGINNNMEKWELSYNELNDAEVQVLLNFFFGLNGVTNFAWQPKFSAVAKKYICPRWRAVPVGDNDNQFFCSIQQVPEL